MTAEELRIAFKYEPSTGFLYRLGDTEPAGRIATKGYRQIAYKGKRYMAHRMVWMYFNGDWPEDQLDHINQQKDDNRIENLRQVTNRQNFENVTQWAHNKSGRRGVSFTKDRYQAEIKVKKKTIHLGVYDNIIDAVAARMRGEREYFTLLEYAPVYASITHGNNSPSVNVPIKLGPWAPKRCNEP